MRTGARLPACQLPTARNEPEAAWVCTCRIAAGIHASCAPLSRASCSNALNGIPTCASPFLAHVLRDVWGFEGYQVSLSALAASGINLGLTPAMPVAAALTETAPHRVCAAVGTTFAPIDAALTDE